jgi:hypothetical protein
MPLTASNPAPLRVVLPSHEFRPSTCTHTTLLFVAIAADGDFQVAYGEFQVGLPPD